MERSKTKDKSAGGDTGKEKKTNPHKLALKGSSKMVSEFFEYSINTILYQRGIYPIEDFHAVKKYGLNMLVTSDDQVKAYIKKIMSQLNKWMVGQKISKLVIVFTGKETGENVERWQFDVQLNKPVRKTPSSSSRTTAGDENSTAAPSTAATQGQEEKSASDEEIQAAIRALFRQITASVTFLPELNEPCTFNVLVYADADSEVPVEWGDSDAKEIDGGEKVQLRSFSTTNHRVDTLVSYKLGD